MNLILTFDYELYGDGSGDVFEQMITPTNRILDICDSNAIKTTLFFEVLEYIKIKQEWDSGNKMGYDSNPVEAIEKQIWEATKNGHDIQLHVHPQWINATYTDDKWNVDLSNWRLGDFSTSQNYTIHDLLKEGKETIENLVREVHPTYNCEILRAGGYNVMPSQEVHDAMIDLGLKADSSVYPGGFETGDLSRYDYSEAPLNKDKWTAKSSNFAEIDENGKVVEIPIFALPQIRLRKFNIDRIMSALKNKKSAVGALKSKTAKKSKFEKVKYFFEREAFTWDFCLFTFKMHKRFFRHIDKKLINERSNFVLIGHPKGFVSDKAFIQMIEYSQNKNHTFSTLKDYYEKNS